MAINNKFYQDIVEQQVAVLLGLKKKTIGKTEARQKFLPLINELDQSNKTFEITDHNEPVAVLIGYHHWSAVISKLSASTKSTSVKPKIDLMGSVKIIGDLKAASKRMTREFEKAAKESGRKLHKELR